MKNSRLPARAAWMLSRSRFEFTQGVTSAGAAYRSAAGIANRNASDSPERHGVAVGMSIALRNGESRQPQAQVVELVGLRVRVVEAGATARGVGRPAAAEKRRRRVRLGVFGIRGPCIGDPLPDVAVHV